MPVTEWFIIKSLTMPSSWIAVLLAILMTGIIVRYKFGKETKEWFSDAAFLFLVIWKFSVIITDFELIIDFPLSILYFNGGSVGLFLGVTVALMKLLWQFKQGILPESELGPMLFSIVMLQSLYQIMMVLLNDAALWQKIITLILFVLITTLTWLKITSSTTWQFQLPILFLLTHIFVALIQPQGVLQIPLFVTGLLVVCGLLACVLTNKQQEFTEE